MPEVGPETQHVSGDQASRRRPAPSEAPERAAQRQRTYPYPYVNQMQLAEGLSRNEPFEKGAVQ
eukprot:5916547-Amphidinium_carterae.1